MTADHGETLGLSLVVVAALVLASSCVHRVTVPVVVSPIIQWTIPVTFDDDVRICVETMRGVGGVDPSDAFPLRCVSVGTIRAWMHAQRMANE